MVHGVISPHMKILAIPFEIHEVPVSPFFHLTYILVSALLFDNKPVWYCLEMCGV